MSMQSEFQEKSLDTLESERRIKIGRSLAKAVNLPIWVNVMFAIIIWLLNPEYIQFFWYGILLTTIGITFILQPVFERKGMSNIWANFLSTYVILFAIIIPYLIPQTLLALAILYIIVFLIRGLLLGSKQFFIGSGIGIPAFIFTVLVGHTFTYSGFKPLSQALSHIIEPTLEIFSLITAVFIFYLILIGQEKLYRQAQQARMESEQANRAKSAFLATMSHEIRTPMNAVLGMTSLLLETSLTPDQEEYATIIRRSGDALLAVINDILDFSKIEAGHIDLESESFDLRECVEGAVSLLTSKAVEKNIELSCLLDPDLPAIILGDESRLRQILLNLLSNSFKFTEKGEVALTVTSEKTNEPPMLKLHFSVSDTGVGITADGMQRLFQSFSQADSSITRKYGGTGLGLVISKRLSELMGGTMWVESEGIPGKGSTFHFTIQTQEQAQGPQRSFLQHAQADLKNKRVLIVDDNQTNQRLLTLQTKAWGMEALVAQTPQEALAWIERGDPFDVAILDHQMPEMDGLTLIANIRKQRDAASLPIILASSLGRELAAQKTFSAYLQKPIRASQLYDTLIEVFSAKNPPPLAASSMPQSEFDPEMSKRLPLRILLADDYATNRKLALLMLKRLGYRADIAADGLEVLSSLERQPYDVILMDMQMPEMDGLEATRQVRQRWPNGPRIVAMTANVNKEDYQACLDAGMDDYLAKPIRVKELITALNKCQVIAVDKGRPTPQPVSLVHEIPHPAEPDSP